jgi:hypothetical protein
MDRKSREDVVVAAAGEGVPSSCGEMVADDDDEAAPG